MALRELQRQEAEKRLEVLEQKYNLHPNVLKEFRENGTIYYSEYLNKFQRGILYWVKNNKQYVDIVKEVEKKYNIFVYHLILSHTELGDWLTMLFVSADEEIWKHDREELTTSRVFSYVHTFNEDSEFGYIQIEGINGGIDRIS